jgi:hypothetical protein
MLNHEYEWNDLRYQINREASHDITLSFTVEPSKEKLETGTVLYRLDFPVVLGIFMKTWWMREMVFQRIFERAGSSPSSLRDEWQNRLALMEPNKGVKGKFGGWKGEAATRTQVFVIKLTQPVYAWIGIATPLFHKPGGEEQVYLPNLAHGAGPYYSRHARLLRTYTLRAT